jgi:hypothetical protein
MMKALRFSGDHWQELSLRGMHRAPKMALIRCKSLWRTGIRP